MSTPGLATDPAGRPPIATFRILRTGYSGEHATIRQMHVYDEKDLLKELWIVLPHLDQHDSLVGIDGPALTMLLNATIEKFKVKVSRPARREHREKGGRRR